LFAILLQRDSQASTEVNGNTQYITPEMVILAISVPQLLYHNLFMQWQQTGPQPQQICMYHKLYPDKWHYWLFSESSCRKCQATQSFEEALFTASNLLFVSKCAKCGIAITETFTNTMGD